MANISAGPTQGSYQLGPDFSQSSTTSRKSTAMIVPVAKPAYFAQNEGAIGPAPTAPNPAAATPSQPIDTFQPQAMTVSTVDADGSASTVPAREPVPAWVWLVGAGLVLWLLMGKRSR